MFSRLLQFSTYHFTLAYSTDLHGFLRSALYVQVALPQLLGAEANEKALVAELGCRFLLHVR